MKVLILHQFYNSPGTGGALRSYYLAQALAAHGVDTVVITTHNGEGIIVRQEAGVTIHYLPVIYNNRFGFFKRVYSFLSFVWSIVRYASRFRDAQVCYAISTPLTTGLAALWINYRYRIPYHFEVGDLWPEAPIQMGFIRNAVLKKILFRLEKTIYIKSISVIALSPEIQEAILQKVPGKTVYVIPNMADTDYFKPTLKNPGHEQKYKVAGKLVVSYIGTLGLANGLDYLLAFAEEAEKVKLPVHVILCGDGAEYDRIQAMIKEKQLHHVSLLPFQNREGVREVLGVTDVVFVCYKSLPVLQTGSPNKFFDGLAAGKMMALNVGGWLKDLVEDSGCGIAVDPHNPYDLVQKLEEVVSNPGLLAGYQRAARALAEQRFSRKKLAARFVKVVANR